jgi:hypothetical protein
MKTTQYSAVLGTTPEWLHDSPSFANLVPGGARLKESTVIGKFVPGGSMVGRTATQSQWTLIPYAAVKTAGFFTTKMGTTLVNAAIAGDTVFTVANTDGFVAGQSVKIGAATALTIASVNKINNTITTSAGLSVNVAAGAVVELNTAVNIIETFINFTEISDTTKSNEFTLLRKGRMVYTNFLPGFASFSADYLAEIKANYQCITSTP